jgi:hypothetical protein
MKLFRIAIIAYLTIFILHGRAEDTKSFPIPEWESWLRVDYPARFKMAPESLQGEAKWWAKFVDPDSDLSFELIAFGFISDLDLLRTVPGYNQDNTFDNLAQLGLSRTDRILEGGVNDGPSWSLWAVIFLTSGLVLGCAITYGVAKPGMHYPMVAIVGMLVAANLFLVLELSHPFAGDVSATPIALQKVIEALTQPPA